MSICVHIVMLPVIVLYLTDDMLGLWYVFLSINAITMLFDFGFSVTFARNIAYCWSGGRSLKKESVEFTKYTEPDFQWMKIILEACRRIYLYLSLMAFALITTIGTIYIVLITRDIHGATHFIAWAIFSVACFLNLYYGYYLSFLRGVGAVAEANKNTIIARTVQIILTVTLLILGAGIIGTSIGYLAYGTVFRALGKWKFYQYKGIGDNLAKIKQRTESKQIKDIIRIIWYNAWRDGLVSMSHYLNSQSTVIICSLFFSLTETGVYSLCIQMATVVATVSSGLLSAYTPTLQAAYINRNLEKTQKSMSLIIVVYVLSFIVLSITLIFIGIPVLHWIKPEIIINIDILLGILLAQGILKYRNCYAIYFSCSNRILYYKSFIISSCLCIILSLLFVKVLHLGIYGLIVAQILSQVIYNLWIWPMRAHKDMKLSLKKMINFAIDEIKTKIR